jgi:S1-C subfamily serine protease
LLLDGPIEEKERYEVDLQRTSDRTDRPLRGSWVCLALTLLLGIFVGHAAAAAPNPLDAVLKVYVTQLTPNYALPWQSLSMVSISGSGFVIEDPASRGRWILTSAHVVCNATYIEVRKYGGADRVPARVVYISDNADLALLAVDRSGFFDSITPLELGPLPELRQEVAVLGYPMGGDTLSVTRGVVSRIEHESYVHSEANLLAGQIDSAVNPGNSGGPVLAADGRAVGVAMQVQSKAQGMAYMVPTTVIKQFLTDIADGRYDGIPATGVRWEPLEAADLRSMYGLSSSQTGVLVLSAIAGSAAKGVVKRGDVLLSVDGHDIGNDGTVEFRERERTQFSYLIEQHQLGDTAAIAVLRKARILHLELPLNQPLGANHLVPGPLYQAHASYYIFGGFVFCPLTVNYVHAWDNWVSRAPHRFQALFSEFVQFEGEQRVVLCGVLQDELNSGYGDDSESLIIRADGLEVGNLAQLVKIVEARDTGLLVLETQESALIVLDRARARQRGPSILARYQVPSDRSADLTTASSSARAASAGPVGGNTKLQR